MLGYAAALYSSLISFDPLFRLAISLVGFPPIHGMEASSGDQSIMGVLETAIKLANQEDRENDEEDDNVEGMKKVRFC